MSDASLPHCEVCEQPEYACLCGDVMQLHVDGFCPSEIKRRFSGIDPTIISRVIEHVKEVE